MVSSGMRDKIWHKTSLLPVTALAFSKEASHCFIIAGKGPYLRIYDELTGSLLLQEEVFQSQDIHGITVEDQGDIAGLRVLTWGGYHVTLLHITYDHNDSKPILLVRQVSEAVAADRIINGSFLPFPLAASEPETPGPRAVMVTAHSSLLLLTSSIVTSTESSSHFELLELCLGSMSILYSAHMIWISPTHILLASGTMFGEILVWSCYFQPGFWQDLVPKAVRKLRHVFTGHEGSIFGVHIIDTLESLGSAGPKGLLASCSDDRSIRVWDISDCFDGSNSSEDINPEEQLVQETGFGERFETSSELGLNRCIAISWGHHVSRIWGVRFLPTTSPDSNLIQKFDLLSYGEDATCQQWALTFVDKTINENGNTGLRTAQLRHLKAFRFHNGKNIWSMAILATPKSSFLVATGGADGGLITFRVAQDDEHHTPGISKQEDYIFEDFLKLREGREPRSASMEKSATAAVTFSDSDESRPGLTTPTLQYHAESPASETLLDPGDSWKDYVFVDEDRIIVTTAFGVILRLDNRHDTKVLGVFEALSHYSVVTGVPGSTAVFFAGSRGQVYCYHAESENICLLTDVEQKVSGLFAHKVLDNILVLVITCVGSANAYTFMVRYEKDDSASLTIVEEWTLGLPLPFVVTSMRLINTQGLMIIGARSGAIAFYHMDWESQDQGTVLFVRACFRHLQGEDAVTIITEIPVTSSETTEYILTAGRNGAYVIYRLFQDQNHHGFITRMRVCPVHISRPPFGPNIEGAYFSPLTQQLILYGFRSTEFIVWNESTQTEVMSVECGGAHRSWAYSECASNDAGGTFVWTKASKFKIRRQLQPSHRVVEICGHGRELKAIAVSPLWTHITGQTRQFLATGAEDTTIRLWEYVDGFRCLGVFRNHTAGIQHLYWSACGRYLFSSAGAEEFFIWRLRDVPGFGLGVIREGACAAAAKDSGLRIMSFTVSEIKASALNPTEVRPRFLISMVYSDSTIRIYQYSHRDSLGTFDLLLTGTYALCCLTQAYHHIVNNQYHLCTAGTDGHIALWNLTTGLGSQGISIENDQPTATAYQHGKPLAVRWKSRIKVHQSTVKCLTAVQIFDECLLLATGGDDNALGFTIVRFPKNNYGEGPNSTTMRIPMAHASAVTVIAALPVLGSHRSSTSNGGYRSQFRFATSSNDQQLKVWSIAVETSVPGIDGLHVNTPWTIRNAVADASSMVVMGSSGNREVPGETEVVLSGVGLELYGIAPYGLC